MTVFLIYWVKAVQKHWEAVSFYKSFFMFSPYSTDWWRFNLQFVFSSSRLVVFFIKHVLTKFAKFQGNTVCWIFFQKQPSRCVLIKRCPENIQQIYRIASMLKCDYRKAPMLKCDFNKCWSCLATLLKSHFGMGVLL